MKYIKPTIQVERTQCAMMVAVSIIDSTDADPDSPILTKEEEWEMWDDEV